MELTESLTVALQVQILFGGGVWHEYILSLKKRDPVSTHSDGPPVLPPRALCIMSISTSTDPPESIYHSV